MSSYQINTNTGIKNNANSNVTPSATNANSNVTPSATTTSTPATPDPVMPVFGNTPVLDFSFVDTNNAPMVSSSLSSSSSSSSSLSGRQP